MRIITPILAATALEIARDSHANLELDGFLETHDPAKD
jgi:hypothetical protein